MMLINKKLIVSVKHIYKFVFLDFILMSVLYVQLAGAKEPATISKQRSKENIKAASNKVGHLAGSREKNKIILNFEDTDLKTVLRFLAEITEKTILPGKSVSGKITIINPEPVTPEEAKQIIYSALEMHKFTVVKQKNYIKIVKSAEAIRNPIKTKVIDRK